MLRAKTVLVVGAGASCEAYFPDGRTLLKQIVDMLSIEFDDFGRPSQGDRIIEQLLRRAHQRFGGINSLIDAAWRIRDAASMAASIDNIIEQHDDSEAINFVGKLAIVRSILTAEQNSSIARVPRRLDEIEIEAVANAWYGPLVELLCENVPRRRAEEVFDNLSIVCFNYDRAIEHVLPFALQRAWGLELDHARALVAKLEIIHPYGQVGALSSPGRNDGVPYGASEWPMMAELVTDIRTFSERVQEEKTLSKIRSLVGEAEQVIFLGFAFHQPNMELITPENPRAKRALATAFKLPENEVRQIEKQIRGMFRLHEGIDGLVLHNGTCSSLIRENWRTITAA